MKPTRDELDTRDLLTTAEDIAKRMHTTLEEMFSPERAYPATRGRRLFYAHLRNAGWSPANIGRLVGKERSAIADQLRVFDREEP